VKRTDLLELFGEVTQTNPLYLQNVGRRNQPVGSLNADRLKSGGRICVHCNTTRTKPHDKAWTKLSRELRRRLPEMQPGQTFRGSRVFPYDTRRQMVGAHLYFVKIFGCHVAELGIPLDLASFGAAIMNDRPHPKVHLKFGFGALTYGEPHTGHSDIFLKQTPDGEVKFAWWHHGLGGLSIKVMFAEGEKRHDQLVDAWHPNLGTSNLKIADFRSLSNEVESTTPMRGIVEADEAS
jgi:hypothetical protein